MEHSFCLWWTWGALGYYWRNCVELNNEVSATQEAIEPMWCVCVSVWERARLNWSSLNIKPPIWLDFWSPLWTQKDSAVSEPERWITTIVVCFALCYCCKRIRSLGLVQVCLQCYPVNEDVLLLLFNMAWNCFPDLMLHWNENKQFPKNIYFPWIPVEFRH